ncbi:MAG: SGNH hydrolase domain-containing protein, partial [Dehalococcoidia bacterium]
TRASPCQRQFFLIGDSHSAAFQPGIAELARANGFP